MPYLSASEVMFHEEALSQVYVPLPLPLPLPNTCTLNRLHALPLLLLLLDYPVRCLKLNNVGRATEIIWRL